jgi:hypothetical protein
LSHLTLTAADGPLATLTSADGFHVILTSADGSRVILTSADGSHVTLTSADCAVTGTATFSACQTVSDWTFRRVGGSHDCRRNGGSEATGNSCCVENFHCRYYSVIVVTTLTLSVTVIGQIPA